MFCYLFVILPLEELLSIDETAVSLVDIFRGRRNIDKI
jgi:hypothetical protein